MGLVQIGYNHNIRHQERSFHVQTQDMGERSAVVTTEIFHEGVAIASRSTSYRGHSAADVKDLMQEQHKAMLWELRSGAFDARIAELLEPKAQDSGPRDGSPPPVPLFAVTASSPEITSRQPQPLAVSTSGLTVEQLILRWLLEATP